MDDIEDIAAEVLGTGPKPKTKLPPAKPQSKDVREAESKTTRTASRASIMAAGGLRDDEREWLRDCARAANWFYVWSVITFVIGLLAGIVVIARGVAG